jgi:adenylyltransferase/sulfurtransferase
LEISCLEVKTKLDANDADLFLLDCRESNEYALVSIAAAVLVPMSELAGRVGELDEHRERHIVVHCHLGGRSAQVAAWLRQQGFPRAQSMAGGIEQWAVEIEPRMARY